MSHQYIRFAIEAAFNVYLGGQEAGTKKAKKKEGTN